MSSRILHKRSLTAGAVPTTSSLNTGELAINVNDGKAFLRRSGSGNDDIIPIVTANTITTGSITATSFTGSLNGTAATASYYQETDPIFTSKSASLATTGSNTFIGNQTITGSLVVTNNLTVLGSASIQYISESVLNIGTNLITVNTFNPSIRFGGLAVIDSGSSPLTSASFLYDSAQNEFIFVHRGDGVNITSSHFLLGPETYNNQGNETYLTLNRIPKSNGNEHLNDSNISDNGSVVTINSNTSITGSTTISGSTIISGGLRTTGTTPSSCFIDTDNGSLHIPNGNVIFDWSNGFISDALQKTVLNIGSRALLWGSGSHPSSEQTAIDFYNIGDVTINGNIYTPDLITGSQFNILTYNSESGQLYYTASKAFIDTFVFPYSGSAVITGSLIVNDGTYNIVDTSNFQLNDSNGFASINWNSRYLQNGNETPLNWGSKTLADSNNDNLSLDWEQRYLYANNGSTIHIDWSNPDYMSLPNISESSITNILGIDGGGRVYYTASSAIGGGGATFPYTGSAIITGSLVVTGSTTSTLGFTGSLFGTASWADSASQALTASLATTASYVTGSVFTSANPALSASFASTASFVSGTFLQGGNSFGTTTVLGTNDTQDLAFETSGSTRMLISSSGLIQVNSTTPYFQSDSITFQVSSGGSTNGIGFRNNNLYLYPYVTSTNANTSSIILGADNEAAWTIRNLHRDAFQIRSTPGAETAQTILHLSSGSGGHRVGILTENPQYTLDVSGSTRVAGSVFTPSLTTTPQLNVVTIDTASGQLYYTASSAFGGGGGPSTFNSTSSFVGDGVNTSYNINHGFNTRNLHITVYESSSNGETVYPDIRRINANTASIIFANPPSTDQYIVYISQ